ncbi:hypothetical protein K438DRAFT_1747833 [Mycena galopus ATCC 62051]|nr:hypothetical protein K438DRAFT_1747833 [Mycena galopus ATCC 62051]
MCREHATQNADLTLSTSTSKTRWKSRQNVVLSREIQHIILEASVYFAKIAFVPDANESRKDTEWDNFLEQRASRPTSYPVNTVWMQLDNGAAVDGALVGRLGLRLEVAEERRVLCDPNGRDIAYVGLASSKMTLPSVYHVSKCMLVITGPSVRWSLIGGEVPVMAFARN